uniref:Uncharacterized protein n=1 Tax=Meloidogyne incognita TaxID=6306 RepID=A0A914LC48_MELIC
MSPKLEQQFNNNVEEERANNRNYLFKKFKSLFPPKLQKQNLIFILFIYLIFLAQLISCYSMTVNRRHLRRAIEYQQNSAIPRYQCPTGCRCVPDNKVNHLLSITCHWPYLKNSRIFNNFPKNGTKSLNIFCEKEEYIEDNILAIDGNFFGFDELGELKINISAPDISKSRLHIWPELASFQIMIDSKKEKNLSAELAASHTSQLFPHFPVIFLRHQFS